MSTTKPAHPKGFTCECGKFHLFGMYVAAHYNVDLTHTCDGCGAQHVVRNYRVRLTRKGKKQ